METISCTTVDLSFMPIYLFIFIVQDENRYSAGRGAHKNLKRAEKARNLVGKIPGELVIIINICN